MKDGTRELTNNQWLLKADADKLPATYAELVTLLTGAGLPFGRTLLSDGWTIEPDALNKASLLKDVTAGLYNLPATAVPDDAFKKAAPKKLLQSYTTAGTFAWTAPDRNGDGTSYEIFVIVVGGGGSGAVQKYWYGTTSGQGQVSGGGSGFSKQFKLTVTPGNTYTVVVGAGGLSVTAGSGESMANALGKNGNSSSFNGVTALGGDGGKVYPSCSGSYIHFTKGGRPADAPLSVASMQDGSGTIPVLGIYTPAHGDRTLMTIQNNSLQLTTVFTPSDCINQVTGEILLAAGGSLAFWETASINSFRGQAQSLTINGLAVGTSAMSLNNPANLAAPTPTLPGAGGGACANCGTTNNTTCTATSGKGVDGAVFIYA